MTTKKRTPLRCRLRIHAWERWGNGWACRRCEAPAPVCGNCSRQHDPNVITICTVRSWR